MTDTRSVLCPVCAKALNADTDITVLIDFSMVSASVDRDGRIEIGKDVYATYNHLECGTRVRLHIFHVWNSVGDYIRDTNFMIEIDTSEYQSTYFMFEDLPADEGRKPWWDTYNVLTELWHEVRAKAYYNPEGGE